MNREIKFRIWREEAKAFDFTSSTAVCKWVDGAPYLMFLAGYVRQYEPFSIQQYTGLKDCKGVEIYEGDILQNYVVDEEYISPCVVVWAKYDESGWFLATTKHRLLNGRKFTNERVLHLLEHDANGAKVYEEYPMLCHGRYGVIGNIFETPELLKA